MNKYIFYTLIVSLALVITLFAVYFVNLSTMNQSTKDLSTQSFPSQERNSDSNNESSLNNQLRDSIVIDEKTPKNYNNEELIKIEQELNSLDLSNEFDIE
jgi:hypothetical protein